MSIRFLTLDGLTPYIAARDLQLELVEKRIRDEIPDTVLFLEHAPTITRGRGLQFTGEPRAEKQIPLTQPLPENTEYHDSERGGDLTWHGPGQLVIYPIIKLTSHDLNTYIRFLEQIIIDELLTLKIPATRKPNASGVWVGEKKLASLGIAVRRWVTYHGIALNLTNSLEGFHLITPCGYSPEVMARVVDYHPQANRADFESRLVRRWSAQSVGFDLQKNQLHSKNGRSFPA